jgi:hypothetical protein
VTAAVLRAVVVFLVVALVVARATYTGSVLSVGEGRCDRAGEHSVTVSDSNRKSHVRITHAYSRLTPNQRLTHNHAPSQLDSKTTTPSLTKTTWTPVLTPTLMKTPDG